MYIKYIIYIYIKMSQITDIIKKISLISGTSFHNVPFTKIIGGITNNLNLGLV